jgi:hypothetical protein
VATIEREFYRSPRGPAPTDEDTWRWSSTHGRCVFWFGTNGRRPDITASDEFGIAEFLAQDGAAAAALIKILFGRVPVECLRDSKARTAPPPPRSFRVGLHHYKLVACSGCIE